MPADDSPSPVPDPAPWRVISPETVAKAHALAAGFRASRRDSANAGRELGRLLRDAEHGKPGPKPKGEIAHRLSEYSRLIAELHLSAGTAVNLKLLAEIPDDVWADAMKKKKDEGPPSLTALYALGRWHRDGDDDGETKDNKDGDREINEATLCAPALVDLLAPRELRSTLLYVSIHHIGATSVPPSCPPLDPSRVRTLLRRLHGPVRSLLKVVDVFDGHAKAAIRAANAKDAAS